MVSCCSGGGSEISQPMYGMTSAISLAGPTALDHTLTASLEETLRSFDMYESSTEMALRYVAYFFINELCLFKTFQIDWKDMFVSGFNAVLKILRYSSFTLSYMRCWRRELCSNVLIKALRTLVVNYARAMVILTVCKIFLFTH